MSDRAIYAPGDRVSLATLEREDVPTLHRWLNDPRVLAALIGDPADWGQGYASAAKALLCRYAFDTLGLHRLESHTLAGNLASQRHLLKNGYRQEGVFRSRVFRAGAWHDTVHFGLLSEDWRRQSEPAPPQGG